MYRLSVLDILDFARRHFRRLALWSAGLAAAGYLACYIIPPTYRATAVLLPPEEDELTAAPRQIDRFRLDQVGGGGVVGLGREVDGERAAGWIILLHARAQNMHLTLTAHLAERLAVQ